ncbi:MAG: 4Fe-4S binding protein, partial [Anaerolineae bacterium]
MNDAGTQRFDLLQIPVIRWLLCQRAFQWVLTTLMLFFFALAILTGFFGTPAGNKNFSIIFVWIVWWALVIILLVPLAGRFWCTICPIPMPGEWAQRRALIGRRPGKLFGLGRRWPRRLRGIWLQNAAFLGVALLSGILLTRPLATGIALLFFVVAAFVFSLVFERRTFCRYLCPVGGFIGLYSMAAPLELRVRDREVCRTHTEKTCYLGNAEGYGCPWLVFPGALERNTYCGLCTECLKTCELNNIVLNLRPPGADLLVAQGRRLDEAYKGFIMLSCALIYSAVFLGPWGWLKD